MQSRSHTHPPYPPATHAHTHPQALRSLVAATYAAGTTQPRKPLWFAGHSLGAAMAVLFAHYVRTNSECRLVPHAVCLSSQLAAASFT